MLSFESLSFSSRGLLLGDAFHDHKILNLLVYSMVCLPKGDSPPVVVCSSSVPLLAGGEGQEGLLGKRSCQQSHRGRTILGFLLSTCVCLFLEFDRGEDSTQGRISYLTGMCWQAFP